MFVLGLFENGIKRHDVRFWALILNVRFWADKSHFQMELEVFVTGVVVVAWLN